MLAIGHDCSGGELSGGGSQYPIVHVIDCGICGGCSRGCTACLNDCRAALCDGRAEVICKPCLVNKLACCLACNSCVGDVGVLICGVVAPDDQVLHVSNSCTGLVCQLRDCTVVIQAHHCGEARCGNVTGCVSCDGCVGVCGVANNQNAHVFSSAVVDGLALRTKNTCVGLEEVSALHTRTARHCADQEGGVGALECSLGIIVDIHACEQRECTVIKLHCGALSGLHALGDLQQVELNGSIRTEHGSRSDAEKKGVTDVSGCTGDGDNTRFCHCGHSFSYFVRLSFAATT